MPARPERFYLASWSRNLARHLAFTDRGRADRRSSASRRSRTSRASRNVFVHFDTTDKLKAAGDAQALQGCVGEV
jgi:hypothetical protein